MVRVALVGLGFMGRMHLGIYGNIDGVEVTALCDSRKEGLDLSAGGGGNIEVGELKTDLSKAKKYTDYEEMLRDGGFDYVDLCVPTYLHKDYTVMALRAGYDVFCEKPMALSTADAEEMIKVSEETGKLLTVGQCLRFWPMYVRIKEILDSKEYGEVISAEFSRYSAPPSWAIDDWMVKGELSGNAAVDLHIHDVDIIHFYFGKPLSVTSSGVEGSEGGYGHISTIYEYADKKTVTSVGNWLCVDTFPLIMRALIVLENAVINLDTSQSDALVIYENGKDKIVPKLDPRDGYYFELVSFVENVKTRTAPKVVTAESAKESLNTVMLEVKSAEKGKNIKVK